MSSIVTKIAVVIAMLAIVFGLYNYNENKKLNKQISDKEQNIKSLNYGTVSYKDQLNKYHSQSIEQVTKIAELQKDKDSIAQQMLALDKKYKINIKKVIQQGQIDTKLVHDTSLKIITKDVDTTYNLSSKPYIVETIRIKNDSLTRNLQVYNKQNLVWHTQRETIDPPKKFFLLRWFQKKQDVTYIDIINDNPFIETTNQQFRVITK